MIENITLGQMDAIVEVVCHLVNGLIPYLIIDRRYFRRTRLILRQLAVSRPPFNVKRRVLLHNRWLVHLLFKQQNSFHKSEKEYKKRSSKTRVYATHTQDETDCNLVAYAPNYTCIKRMKALFENVEQIGPMDLIRKVRKEASIRNRYNQVPHLTQDTTWERDKNTIKHHKREPS